MSAGAPFRPGDVVIVLGGAGGKDRPAVVVDLQPDGPLLLVIEGTGTPRDPPRLEVRERTRAAFRMGLSKTTHFYASAAGWFPPERLRSTGRTTPAEVFQQLRELLAG